MARNIVGVIDLHDIENLTFYLQKLKKVFYLLPLICIERLVLKVRIIYNISREISCLTNKNTST